MANAVELDPTYYGAMEVDISEAQALGKLFYRN
jgi:hypothetical protein